MAAYAQDAVDMAKLNFSENLDYSERSVEIVERCLSKLYSAQRKGFLGRLFGRSPSIEQISTVAKMFGGYIGEVFRKHHGGEWLIDETISPGSPVLALRYAGGGRFFPPAKVFRRLTDGDSDNVWVFYQVLTREIIKRV